jgi:pyoverdine/dityrosine biosynthesis protein Dit1
MWLATRPQYENVFDLDFLSEQILAIVFRHRNVAPSSRAPSGFEIAQSNEFHRAKIRHYLERNLPVTLVLPAFPAKSPNPKKTAGSLPDYGEVLALRMLNELCKEIQSAYSPGAEIIICSDGRVFSDLVQVSDDAVNEYGREIKKIIEECHFTHLTTHNLEDVFDDCQGFDEMRDRLVKEYAQSTGEVREKVKVDEAFRQLFNGIHRFLFEDLLVLWPSRSRNQVRLLSKELAYGVVQRSQAWSGLVERNFPKALRLSIHPQAVASPKIGIRLLPGEDLWGTPWHNVALYDGSRYTLMKREKAEALKAIPRTANGRHTYFVLPTVSPQ